MAGNSRGRAFAMGDGQGGEGGIGDSRGRVAAALAVGQRSPASREEFGLKKKKTRSGSSL